MLKFNSRAYLSDSAVAIIPKKINIFFLLGLLNSKLFGIYITIISPLFGIYITIISPFVQGKYYNYSKGYIEKLPIKIPENKSEEIKTEKIITKVKEILKLKRKDENADTTKLEDEIDDLVYELYGISDDERKTIEKTIIKR